jgi:hypothetical protein
LCRQSASFPFRVAGLHRKERRAALRLTAPRSIRVQSPRRSRADAKRNNLL